MIELIFRNCDDLFVKREFKNEEEFMEIIDGDREDSLMLDDEIISLRMDGQIIAHMSCIDDLYNSYK